MGTMCSTLTITSKTDPMSIPSLSVAMGIPSDSVAYTRYTQKFYELHLGLIAYGCHRYNLSKLSSQDAYADSVAELFRQVSTEQFRGDCSLDSYLFTIFNNRCRNLCRHHRAQKRTGQEVPLADETSSRPNPHRALEDSEAITQIKQACNSLHPRLWHILDAQCIQGYSTAEIAQRLGFRSGATVASVKWRYAKQLQQLCTAFSDHSTHE